MNSKIKKTLAVIGVILALILVWGFIEPHLIDVEEREASITNLPQDMEGEQIAVIGDFQVGLWMDNSSTAERIVERLVELDPAAVLLTGDYVYHVESIDQEEVDEVIEILTPLAESDIPVYGVLGNHDYSLTSRTDEPNLELAEGLENRLTEMGITMLENESAVLESEGEEEFYIVGLGSEYAGNVDVTEAFSDVPAEAPRMVLMHNPDSFTDIGPQLAPVAVAGHTHGGQIRLPFTETWSYLTLVQGGEVTADGWIENYGAEGNELYVNRGIGMSFVPIRIHAMPEITVFELSSE